MAGVSTRGWAALIAGILLLGPIKVAYSEEKKEDGTLEDELEELSEDDYPDLIGADEEGEIIDEFTLLMEDAGIVESAARHKQEIGMSPSAITVITRQDIEASGATTVPDLLRLVPGMDVVVTCPFFTAVTARLFLTEEGNHMLVMIDGRETNFDPLGFPPWEIHPISLEDIERIEIIRGPGSALYGANALTGVVSITTRPIPDRTSASVYLDAGEVGRVMPALRVSTRLGNWEIQIGGAADFSGSFTDSRDISKQIWKFRSLVERRWSDKDRFLIDVGISGGWGPMASPMGTVQSMFLPYSVRLAYESEALDGQLYWTYAKARADIETPLEYAGIRLAAFMPAPMDSHVVDGQVQWTIPEIWDPLLLITGGGVRLSTMSADTMLDADTFGDPTSSNYHQPGIYHWEMRTGVFIHAELAPADWVTVTGGTRVDYNTQSGLFISPRLAAVFQPAGGQFIRIGAARSFRKPSFMETVAHLMVEFPPDSPITGDGQDLFQEFMTRVGGNRNVSNEELTAFEAGYLGQFLDGRLAVSLDLYCNLYRDILIMDSQILEDERGLPDLERSSFRFEHMGPGLDAVGGELSVRYTPSSFVSLLATWSHRQVFNHRPEDFQISNPKNLLTLGGRFRTESGLVGSLYAFSRSEFWHNSVENPGGLLLPLLRKHIDHTVLVLGKLGWRIQLKHELMLEVGVKLFLPISPFSAPHFGYFEGPGGTSPLGENYGAQPLARMVTVYFHGSF